MKAFQVKGLEFFRMQQMVTVQAQDPAPPPPRPSRKQRRANAVFNRKLEQRLAKDQVPITLQVLPDGGIHAHVNLREEEKPNE